MRRSRIRCRRITRRRRSPRRCRVCRLSGLLFRVSETREHPEIGATGEDHHAAGESCNDGDQAESVADHENARSDLKGRHDQGDPPFTVFLAIKKESFSDIYESAHHCQDAHDRGDQFHQLIRVKDDHDPADQHYRRHYEQQRP